jgi:uncharacterized protein (DUF1697 family)
MITYISLLRGINVGGHKKILMSDLTALYQDLGLEKVCTYIQSGNVIFMANNYSSSEEISQKISQKIHEKYGFKVAIFVISITEYKQIISANPFTDTDNVYIGFFVNEPKIKTLENPYPPDDFLIIENAVFVYCPNGYGKTKLSNSFFESKLKVEATTRNWKTSQKMLAMATSLA